METQNRTRIAAALLVPALIALGGCSGGEAAESSSQAEAVPTAPAGTSLKLAMDETVSTKTHEVGEGVTATVTEPVRVDGSVVIPAGAQMIGTVQRSRRSDGPRNPALLAFDFETLRVEGETYPVNAVVEEANPQQTEGDSGAESAAKVAIGTAAGALVGQIIGGDKKSTLGGAAAGTLAGAAVAITSQYGDATLAKGSVITVRLESPVQLK